MECAKSESKVSVKDSKNSSRSTRNACCITAKHHSVDVSFEMTLTHLWTQATKAEGIPKKRRRCWLSIMQRVSQGGDRVYNTSNRINWNQACSRKGLKMLWKLQFQSIRGKDKGEFPMGGKPLWHLAVVYRLFDYPKGQTHKAQQSTERESCVLGMVNLAWSSVIQGSRMLSKSEHRTDHNAGLRGIYYIWKHVIIMMGN